jgi:hypothetical protein
MELKVILVIKEIKVILVLLELTELLELKVILDQQAHKVQLELKVA